MKNLPGLFLFGLVLGVINLVEMRPATALTCSVLQRQGIVTVRNGNGLLLTGIKLSWYRQGVNPDGQPFFNGRAVVSGVTGLNGQWTGCLPKGGEPLALNLYFYSPTLAGQVIWADDLVVTDATVNADVRYGTLDVIIRSASGNALRNRRFDLYREQRDVNGALIFSTSTLVAGKQSTGLSGETNLRVGSGTYVIRIPSDIPNQFIDRSGIVVAPGQAALADLQIETMRLRVVDGIGRVQPKFRFSVYAPGPNGQQVLVGRPLVTAITGTTGEKELLLPAGTYNVVASGSLATVFRKWNQTIAPNQLLPITFRLSGLRILNRDAIGRPLINTRFSVYTQRLDDNGNPAVDRRIVRNRSIGKDGYQDMLLPPGTYVVSINNRRFYNIDVAAQHFSRLDIPRTFTLRVSDEASLTTSLENAGLTYRAVATPKEALARGSVRTVLSGSYQLRVKTINRGTMAIFYISKARIQNEAINTTKLRILFYNTRTKRWSVIGRYDRTRNQVVGTLRQPGIAQLVVLR